MKHSLAITLILLLIGCSKNEAADSELLIPVFESNLSCVNTFLQDMKFEERFGTYEFHKTRLDIETPQKFSGFLSITKKRNASSFDFAMNSLIAECYSSKRGYAPYNNADWSSFEYFTSLISENRTGMYIDRNKPIYIILDPSTKQISLYQDKVHISGPIKNDAK